MWAMMLATEKQDAYAADSAPTTHPIRQELVDVASRRGDASTTSPTPRARRSSSSSSRSSVRTSSSTALRSYFRKHAWGNTTLDDLIAEIAAASGRDLSGWVEGWLETSGTDRLALERHDGGLALVATPPEGRGPLPHRLRIGAYADGGDGLTLLDMLVGRGGRRADPGRGRGRRRPAARQRRRPDLRQRAAGPGFPGAAALARGELPDGGGPHAAADHGLEHAVRRRADRRAVRRLRGGRARPRDG